MGSEVTEINCWCYFFFNFDSLHRHLSNFDEYKCTKLRGGLIVDLKIDGENLRINLSHRKMEDVHVCVDGWSMIRGSTAHSDILRWSEQFRNLFSHSDGKLSQLQLYDPVTQYYYSKYARRILFPTVPIIAVCNHADRKYRPDKMKENELEGRVMMSREIGDKLARELGAVKYIQYSEETGRGTKILIDEIAFAGIGKINDDEKQICSIM